MRSTLGLELPLVSVAVALVALGGCQGPLDAPLIVAHPNDGTPRHGGTLHLATFAADVTTLDPAANSETFSGSIDRLLYAGLVDFDASGSVVPDLAATVEESDEGRTYRFALRDGLRFHDGTAVTAAEVKRSIERALHPSTPSSVASLFGGIEGFSDFTDKKAAHISGIVVEGRSVVAIHLTEPDATFLQLVALAPMRITCPSAGDRFSPSWAPCGAGPFKLLPGGWERGRSLRIVRNDDYFRAGVPYLDAITWELGSTQFAQGLRFARGEQDVVADLSQVDIVRYQADARWQPFGSYDVHRDVQGEAMNTEIPPFDNVEVRRAVAAAIDRDHLVLLRASNLAPQTKPVPDVPGYDPPPIGQQHDLGAALEHMRKAGYAFDPATGRGGLPAPVPYDAYRGFPEATGQVVQQDLARIGIRMEIRSSSFGTWSALTHRRHKSAMSAQGWSAMYPSPGEFLEPRFATRSIADEDGTNYSFYSNPRVDSLLDRAKREPAAEERTRLYAEVERILCDDAPWAFEYSFRRYPVRQPYVRGFRPHAVWTIDPLPLWLDRQADLESRSEAVLSPQLLGSLIGATR